MQISRLLGIVFLLLNQKTVTANELAEHFEVSRRTILRDVQTLSQAGIPVYTTPGKGGGISILDHFILNKTTVSEEEQNQLLFALQSSGAVGQVGTADLLPRLQALFGKTDANWIEADFSRWGSAKPDREKFDLLRTALTARRAIAFTYSNSYGKTTRRTAYPLKLIYKSNAWYLQGYCLLKKDYRIFKVNRILSLELLEESFSEKTFSPPPLEAPESPSDQLIHLVLCFPRHAAYRVYDEFDRSQVLENSDGTLTVSADLPDDRWLYGFLLSFGSSVKVIAPQSVKKKLLRELEKIKKSIIAD